MHALRFNLLILFLTVSAFATGQELIKGIVLDSATFSPLPYVNVQIRHQNKGTTTDERGNFELTAHRTDTLVFSFVGYEEVVYPLRDWEPSIIRMSEKGTLLSPVLIKSTAINPYEGLFDDQNAMLSKRKIPFYFAKYRKEKIRVGWLLEDNLRVKTYLNLLVKDDRMKTLLMTTYKLSEDEYYITLSHFNEQHVAVMYYLTTEELITLLRSYFERAARLKKTN